MDKVKEFDRTCERILMELKVERLLKHGSFEELVELSQEQSVDGYHFDAIESLKIAHIVSANNFQAEEAANLIADNYLSLANDDMVNIEFAETMVDEADKWQKISESYQEEPKIDLVDAAIVETTIAEDPVIELDFSSASEAKPQLVEKIVEKTAKAFYLAKFGLQEVIKRRREANRAKTRFSWLGKCAVTFA